MSTIHEVIGKRPEEGSTSEKKKLKRRSEVWVHFDLTPDSQIAICKYCANQLSGKSTQGTSHLKRHIKICKKCPIRCIEQHPILDSRNEVRSIVSTQKETWDVAKKAIMAEIPFAPPDIKNFWYSTMEPTDVEKEIYAYYEHEKEKLTIELNNLTSRVSFSIEIMEEGYLSLTLHFINADFDFVKKIIGFKKLPDHSTKSIVNVLESCLSEWKLRKEKIFRFTTECVLLEVIEELKKFFPNMLSDVYQVGVHCCKESLKEFYSDCLHTLCFKKYGNTKNFVKALTTIPSRIDTFNHSAKERGLSPINEAWFKDHAERNHFLMLDSSSVARMLEDIFMYRDVFSQYYARTETGQPSVSGVNSSCFDWQRLQVILNFSRLINCVINGLSSFRNPTSHLYFRNIWEIHDLIVTERKLECQSEDGECSITNTSSRPNTECQMEKKEYRSEIISELYEDLTIENAECQIEGQENWSAILSGFEDSNNANNTESQTEDRECRETTSLGLRDVHIEILKVHNVCSRYDQIFIVAGIMDPRYKLHFYEYASDKECKLDPDITEQMISEYRQILKKFLSEYVREEVNNISPSLVGSINTQDGGSWNNRTYPGLTTVTDEFSLYNRGKSELDKYLSEEPIVVVDFDLLGWWKENQLRFPILSGMARHIFAVPACVFSTKSIIKSEFKALEGLDPGLLEAVICSKDWILGREQSGLSEPNN